MSVNFENHWSMGDIDIYVTENLSKQHNNNASYYMKIESKKRMKCVSLFGRRFMRTDFTFVDLFESVISQIVYLCENTDVEKNKNTYGNKLANYNKLEEEVRLIIGKDLVDEMKLLIAFSV